MFLLFMHEWGRSQSRRLLPVDERPGTPSTSPLDGPGAGVNGKPLPSPPTRRAADHARPVPSQLPDSFHHMNQVVLITGANGALGLAMARAWLEEPRQTGDPPNHRVWLGVRRGRDQAAALAEEHPGHARLIDLDVTSPDAWRAAVATIHATDQRLDVLVNNAGHHDDHLLAGMPAESWQSVIDSNLTGAFHGCQSVVRGMMGQRFGRIVNVASLSALLAPAGQTNYAAAKAGLIAMTRSLAKETARAGITVNAVCPGYIETPALDSMSAEGQRAAKARIPMRRFGRPDEVAAAVRFLSGPTASYISGAELKIDGAIY